MTNSKSRPAVPQVPVDASEHPNQVLESARPVGKAEIPVLKSVGMAQGKKGGWCVYVLETQGDEVVSQNVLNEDGKFLPRAAAENLLKVTVVNEVLKPKKESK